MLEHGILHDESVKLAPQAQFAPNCLFPPLTFPWCLSPLAPVALLCLWLSGSSLWCSHRRWGPFQRHQLGLQPTKTLVMPPGYQGHKRANWKQITHTHALHHIYTCNHAHRPVNPQADHYTHTYHTLNYLEPHSNTLSHNVSHTLALCVFQRPLRRPQRKHLRVRGRGSVHCFLWRACETNRGLYRRVMIEGWRNTKGENPPPLLMWLFLCL